MRRMHRGWMLALVGLMVACGEEYGQREVEIETDPPAVGGTSIDSAAAGATIQQTVPLDTPTTTAPENLAGQPDTAGGQR